MWRDGPYSPTDRIERFLEMARQAEREGDFDLAVVYRRMARDLGPAAVERRGAA
jgi:hypothetical protein